MCLHVVLGVPKKTEGFGWKLYYRYLDGSPRGMFYSVDGNSRGGYADNKIPVGRWMQSSRACVSRMDIEYTAGFHIYTKRPHPCARHGEILMRVKYDNAHTVGLQYGRRVIVADRMLVLPWTQQPHTTKKDGNIGIKISKRRSK